MPRIRQKADVYRNEDFRRDVLSRLALLGIQQLQRIGVCDGTVSVLLRNPEKIQVERLRKMIAFLGLEPGCILRFAGFSTKDIKKEVTE